ncbi:MAG: hypothetical protein JJU28_24920 [Cyclobacteriaceae bacterium]|nr:hypothetical protein [Cyclobacteriaceae bacterium]
MIDLRIQPAAPWFGLDFFTKRIEREILLKRVSPDEYLHLYSEVQSAFTVLFDIPEKFKIVFYTDDQLAQFLKVNNLNLNTSLGENFQKEQNAKTINTCIDVSYEIPFDFHRQIKEGTGLCFDPSKGLGLYPGLRVMILPENSDWEARENYEEGKYKLLRQFQYVLEQISLRGLVHMKHEFFTKAAVVDHMVSSNAWLYGYLVEDKSLRSQYIQSIRVDEPQRFNHYLQSRGFIIEIRNHEWILPNFIVYSKESFYHLSEVMEKYD